MAARSFVTKNKTGQALQPQVSSGDGSGRDEHCWSLLHLGKFFQGLDLTCFQTYFFADYFAVYFLALLYLGPGQESFD